MRAEPFNGFYQIYSFYQLTGHTLNLKCMMSPSCTT